MTTTQTAIISIPKIGLFDLFFAQQVGQNFAAFGISEPHALHNVILLLAIFCIPPISVIWIIIAELFAICQLLHNMHETKQIITFQSKPSLLRLSAASL